MIILITYKDEEDGKTYVSHGVNSLTNQLVVMPELPIFYYDCYFDVEVGEYVLK